MSFRYLCKRGGGLAVLLRFGSYVLFFVVIFVYLLNSYFLLNVFRCYFLINEIYLRPKLQTAQLGPNLGPSWDPIGTQMGPNLDPIGTQLGYIGNPLLSITRNVFVP